VPPSLIERHIKDLAFWKRKGYMTPEQLEKLKEVL
jgi:hypothetical protein